MKSLHYYISSTMSEKAEIIKDKSHGKERIIVELPSARFMIHEVDFDKHNIIIFNRKSAQFHDFRNMSFLQTINLMEVLNEIII